MSLHIARYRRTLRSALFHWENVGGSHSRDPRGSPFQLPARLADGLGHGSDLGHGYPRPFAPPSKFFEDFWVPRVGFQEGKPT